MLKKTIFFLPVFYCAASVVLAEPDDLAVAPEASEARIWQLPADLPALGSDWQAQSQYLSIGKPFPSDPTLKWLDGREDVEPDTVFEGGYVRFRRRKGDTAILRGLAFDARVSGENWPELFVPCAIGIGRHPMTGEWDSLHFIELEKYKLGLGAVRVPAADCELESQESDWAHNTLVCSAVNSAEGANDSFLFTVSRLTPAVLIETSASELELFAGKTTPPYAAFPVTAGIRVFDLTGAGKGLDSALGAIGRQIGGSGGAQASAVAKALADMQGGWVLFWFGKDSPFVYQPYPISYSRTPFLLNAYQKDFVEADCPVLALFGGRLLDISAAEGAVKIAFDSAAERQSMVLLPLFGLNQPGRAVTEKWAAGLPEDVVRRCAWWAEHLARYPLTVREEYGFDTEQNKAFITERFEFKRLRETGGFLAPVPPMLALAKRQGLNISFSGALEYPDCVTGIGPAAGIPNVESYTWTLPELGRYVLERPVAGPKPAPPALQKLLEAEVRKILEAGHLAPWLAIMHDCALDGGYYFLRSDETLRYLGAVLDLLPQELAEQTRQYMRAERAAYPSETCLSLPLFKGARRERWVADERVFRLYKPGYTFKPYPEYVGILPEPVWPRVPVRTLYGLWAGIDAAGEEVDDATWANAQALLMSVVPAHDWASLGWFAGGAELAGVDGENVYRRHEEPYFGGVMAANSYFAGLVGFIRLARLRGDKASEAFGWGLLSRAAALRFAMGKFTGYLYEVGALRIPPEAEAKPDWMTRNQFAGGCLGAYLWAMNWTKPEHDVRQVLLLDERGIHMLEQQQHYRHAYLVPFMHITPELGRFLGDNLRPECNAYFERVRENMPDWYMAYREAKLGGDKQHFRYPSDAHQLFMERAWVAAEPPERLVAWLDIPWLERGDLFFLEKVAATIRAYRGVEWQPVRFTRAGE